MMVWLGRIASTSKVALLGLVPETRRELSASVSNLRPGSLDLITLALRGSQRCWEVFLRWFSSQLACFDLREGVRLLSSW